MKVMMGHVIPIIQHFALCDRYTLGTEGLLI